MVVVERHQHAVGGDVGIGLEVAVAEGHRRLERRHRVLARAALGVRPLVGERQRPGQSRNGNDAIWCRTVAARG